MRVTAKKRIPRTAKMRKVRKTRKVKTAGRERPASRNAQTRS